METIKPAWQHISECQRLLVYEGATAFWIELRITGQEACMGDGVDMLYDNNDRPFDVATPQFYTAMQALIDADVNTLVEAYFPDYEPHVHYIGLGGLKGYLPNFCDVYPDMESAVEGICFIHDLGPHSKFRRNLERDGYTDLILHPRKSPPHPGHGNEYAEIVECDCDTPWEHSDGGQSVEEIIDYLRDAWEAEDED
jgi:hypothetical protein